LWRTRRPPHAAPRRRPDVPPRASPRRVPSGFRHGDPAHEQPGRARPAAPEDPAEDQRTSPVRTDHPIPADHPRLCLHRHKTLLQCHDRHSQRGHRQPLDARTCERV